MAGNFRPARHQLRWARWVDEGELTEVVEQVQPDVLILAMERDPQKSLGQCGFLLGLSPDEDSGAGRRQNRGIFIGPS